MLQQDSRLKERIKLVNLREIVQNLVYLTDTILLAKHKEAVNFSEAKKINKILIVDFDSYFDVMVDIPALPKFIVVNSAILVANQVQT